MNELRGTIWADVSHKKAEELEATRWLAAEGEDTRRILDAVAELRQQVVAMQKYQREVSAAIVRLMAERKVVV